MKSKVLFVDQNHTVSYTAEVIARQELGDECDITSAGIITENQGPSDGRPGTVAFSSVMNVCFDLVITIGSKASEQCAMLPGLPAVIHWDDFKIKDNGMVEDIEHQVKNRVRELVHHGCLKAMLLHHSTLANVVDSMKEGIIVHDLKRRVFLFSKGAQEITGVSRDAVVGHDCHDLFRPRLCGESCMFCDGDRSDASLKQIAYSTHFIGGEGSDKQLDVTRTPLNDEQGNTIGVIATFTDTTHLHDLELRLGEMESFSGIIGRDHRMLEIYELIRDLSDNDFPVVITGESGTGKELVAAAIHNESLRKDNLFVPVNCGALPEGTLESELFGHVKGAFTGAIRDKKGRFELANNGTLFLDEIGDLSLQMQVKLLRVLQEGIFEPVGSESSRKVDVRVICATNRNLKEMVEKGKFREDLFYRLAVVPIEMPPLRERRNDIPLLANHFLEKTTGRLSRASMAFSDDVLSMFMNYTWPGNVRQLQNAIQFALIKCRSATIMPEHLPPELLAATYVPIGMARTPGKVGRRPKLTNEVVERALLKTDGNKAKAARLLGVGRATLYNFMNNRDRELVEAE